MLVLTRHAGESIMIGDDVRIVVLEVRGDAVRIGIEAPRSVQVHRAEVYVEVQLSNAAAAVDGTPEHQAAVMDAVERLQRSARPKGRARATPRTPSPRPSSEDE